MRSNICVNWIRVQFTTMNLTVKQLWCVRELRSKRWQIGINDDDVQRSFHEDIVQELNLNQHALVRLVWLNSVWPKTSFWEIFQPTWNGKEMKAMKQELTELREEFWFLLLVEINCTDQTNVTGFSSIYFVTQTLQSRLHLFSMKFNRDLHV